MFVYMGLIFYVSSQARAVILRSAPDYLLHFAAYFLFGLLAIRATASGLLRPAGKMAVLYGVVLSIAYAVSDEWHQMLVPGRVASLWDVLADTAGVLAAVGLLSIFWRWSSAWETRKLGGSYPERDSGHSRMSPEARSRLPGSASMKGSR